jgi:hypothetical protein
MEAAYQQDIEHGGLQTEIDMFHRAIKKGLWNEAK